MRNTTKTMTITRSGLALAAIPLLVLGLAACSSGGSGSTDTGSTGTDSSSVSESAKKAAAHEFDLAVAKCVRGKGVDAPDPEQGSSGSAINLKDGQDMDTVIAANKDCTTTVEKQLGKRPVTAAEKKANDAAEKEGAKRDACLKEKGYDLSSSSGEQKDLGGGATMSQSSGGVDIPEDVLEACGLGGMSGSTFSSR